MCAATAAAAVACCRFGDADADLEGGRPDRKSYIGFAARERAVPPRRFGISVGKGGGLVVVVGVYIPDIVYCLGPGTGPRVGKGQMS